MKLFCVFDDQTNLIEAVAADVMASELLTNSTQMVAYDNIAAGQLVNVFTDIDGVIKARIASTSRSDANSHFLAANGYCAQAATVGASCYVNLMAGEFSTTLVGDAPLGTGIGFPLYLGTNGQVIFNAPTDSTLVQNVGVCVNYSPTAPVTVTALFNTPRAISPGDITGMQNTLNNYALKSAAEFTVNKGQPSGYAGLDTSGLVPLSQLPTNLPLSTITFSTTLSAETSTLTHLYVDGVAKVTYIEPNFAPGGTFTPSAATMAIGSSGTVTVNGTLNATTLQQGGTPLAKVATSGNYTDLTNTPPALAFANITGSPTDNTALATQLNSLVPKTTTINTHALSANIVLGWSDFSGTVPLTQLPLMVGDTGSGGTAGIVPAPASGDAASNKFLSASGTWVTPTVPASSVAWGNITGTLSSQSDLATALAGKEPSLNNPTTDNYVLTSTAAGVRSWQNASSLVTVTWTSITGKPTFATVATSGSYTDLLNLPVLAQTKTAVAGQPLLSYNASTGAFTQGALTAAQVGAEAALGNPSTNGYVLSSTTAGVRSWIAIPSSQVNSDWNATSGVAQILNKPTLATVATSGSYTDLANKPSIPAASSTAPLVDAASATVGTSATFARADHQHPAVSVNGRLLTGNITITSGDVGNTVAQWNANQLQGYGITTTAPASGNYLSFNGTNWTPVAFPAVVNTVAGRSGTVTLSTSDLTDSNTLITASNIGSQSVNYATTAGSANSANTANSATTAGRAYPLRSDGTDISFIWSGQSGQPPWLWGGSDGVNMYVYNPSNFSVSYANTAGSAGSLNTTTSTPQVNYIVLNDISNGNTYKLYSDGGNLKLIQVVL